MKYLSVCSGISGRPALDMIGLKFGRLTVVLSAGNNKHGERLWECSCECGNVAIVPGYRLRQGYTKSCGCIKRARLGDASRTHGKSKTMPYCMFYDARKRALLLNLPFDLDPEKIIIPEKCPILGLILTSNGSRDSRPSIDRIIPERGYTKLNTRVISFRANRIKSDATASELRAIAEYIDEECDALS